MNEHNPKVEECCDEHLTIVNHKLMLGYHSHTADGHPMLYMMMLDPNENRYTSVGLDIDQVKFMLDKLGDYYLPRMQRRLNNVNLADMKVGVSN